MAVPDPCHSLSEYFWPHFCFLQAAEPQLAPWPLFTPAVVFACGIFSEDTGKEGRFLKGRYFCLGKQTSLMIF